MKKRNIRWLAGLLAIIMLVASLVSCNGTVSNVDTPTDTEAALESATESDTETERDDPRDIPKNGPYVTSTELDIPQYTLSSTGKNQGIVPSTTDILSDTWTAVDGADRSMPSATKTPVVGSQQVGIFYFLWSDASLNGFPVYDHYAAYLEGGMDQLWEVMRSGERGFVGHYWAEPYFGYYGSEDEWVIRKHANMLTEAGVDFVFFDTSNGQLYTGVFLQIIRVWSQMRQEGSATPDVCFLTVGNTDVVRSLWSTLYSNERYKNLYFHWEGKPLLMLTGGISISQDILDYFTIRYSWAYTDGNWYQQSKGAGCWPWIDHFPQAPGFAPDGKTIEQMSVTCGYAANGTEDRCGRSMKRNRIPSYEGPWNMGFALMETTTPYGLLFQEQFDHALKKNPPLLTVTGWNEWWAGRWEAPDGGAGQVIANEYTVSNDPNAKEYSYYVDNLNPEYSRDIEPMKGGFGDNYLYQMAENLRLYKGTRDVEQAFGQWGIDLNGSVGQWYAVGPEYRDNAGDVTHRDAASHQGGFVYKNTSGRNDIVVAKVSNDSKYLYFYVECAADITAPEGDNWMNLFLNTDCDDKTGWYGYDFILNRSQDGNTVSVEAFVGTDEWNFSTVGTAEYVVTGSILQIKVAKALVHFAETMEFKWADNSTTTGEIMEFLDQGDAAPNGRYNYVFTTKSTQSHSKVPEVLTSDMIVLKVNSYNAYVGSQMIRLVEDNTKAVTLASNLDYWLPVTFVESALGISCDGQTTYNHYGVAYVKATDLVAATDRHVTIDCSGLIVISSSPVIDDKTLVTLYRALS